MKNLKTTLGVIPLCVASALGLIACENDNYAALSCTPGSQEEGQLNCASADGDTQDGVANPEPDQLEYEFKGGITGRVMSSEYWVGAEVCLDTNQNGQCDSGSEAVEKTYADGQFSFEPDLESVLIGLKNNARLLAVQTAQNGEVIAVFAPTPDSAIASDTNVSSYTTLVGNEITFNPLTVDSPEQSRVSLVNGSLPFGTDALLQGFDYIAAPDAAYSEQISQISDSLSRAQVLGDKQHYRATAATVTAMYQNTSYVVSVELAGINAQQAIGDVFSSTFSDSAITWKTDHDDEISVDIDTAQNVAVVGSQYHNRLIVFNLDAETPERLSKNLFASSDVARDEIDATTGASEQTLKEIRVTPDSLNVIVAVTKYKESSKEKGVGIYKADLSNPSRIPYIRFAKFEESNDDFYAFPGLTSIALSADGALVAIAGSDKKIDIVNTSDFGLQRSIAFSSKAIAVALDATGSTAYVSLAGDRTGVAVVDTSDGSELSFYDTGVNAPDSLSLFSSDSKIAWYLNKSKVLSIIDSTDKSKLSLVGLVEATEEIKSFDFSSDGTLLTLALKLGNVELHALSPAPHLIDAYQSELDEEGAQTPINAVDFANKERVLVSIKNGIQLLDINTNKYTELSDEERQAWLYNNR